MSKAQMSYVPLCGHTTFVLLTPARTMTVIDEITIICNDVNKTSTSVQLLAINILVKEVMSAYELSQRLDLKPSWKSGMDITPLRIYSSLMNCFKRVTSLRFCNELKFHISSRDGKNLRIKVLISSKSGHGTFVLSAIYYVKSTTKKPRKSSCTPCMLGLRGKSIQVALLSQSK